MTGRIIALHWNRPMLRGRILTQGRILTTAAAYEFEGADVIAGTVTDLRLGDFVTFVEYFMMHRRERVRCAYDVRRVEA